MSFFRYCCFLLISRRGGCCSYISIEQVIFRSLPLSLAFFVIDVTMGVMSLFMFPIYCPRSKNCGQKSPRCATKTGVLYCACTALFPLPQSVRRFWKLRYYDIATWQCKPISLYYNIPMSIYCYNYLVTFSLQYDIPINQVLNAAKGRVWTGRQGPTRLPPLVWAAPAGASDGTVLRERN